MLTEHDKASENPYASPLAKERRDGVRRRCPWWIRQPEVFVGGGGVILFLLLSIALLLYSMLFPE